MSDLSVAPYHEPSGRLRGLRAVVTGATSGVGLEVVRVFDAEGAQVVAGNLDAQALEAQLGTGPTVLVGRDVTVEADRVRLIAAAEDAWGGVDILVNNAGATIRGDLEETTPDLLDRALAVHLSAAVHLSRLVAPSMRTRRTGSIINMASITSLQGLAGAVAYTAAKGGLTAMTRATAVELAGDGVRVNAICPGSSTAR